MELVVKINDKKSNLFFEFLKLFQKDGLVDEYKIIYNDYEKEVLNDLKELKSTLNDAKNGKGNKTNKFIEINL